ncbi:MAG: hypothetical protein AB7P40_14315 [Chloroflexota bacterium]
MRSYLQVQRQAPPVLAGGESVALFPQGSILGIEIEFKRGPFALALALDRPILPVATTGRHHRFAPYLGASVLATAPLRPARKSPGAASDPSRRLSTRRRRCVA